MEFKIQLKQRQDYVNDVLDKFLPTVEGRQKTVLEAMRYSVTIGGKRLRPILILELYRCFSGTETECKIEPFVAAIEMLHTYSLVHDDLPDMDNDMYRRGQLTTHAKYGSAMAILAGDALLNYSFETIGKAFDFSDSTDWNQRVAKAMQVFSKKAGIYGMIGILIMFTREYAPLYVVGVVAFPLIYTISLSGFESIDSYIKDEVRLLTNNNVQVVGKIYLPLSFPYLLTAIVQSFGLGLKVLVMAEYLSQPKYSIGNEIVFYKDIAVSMEYVYAWSIILIIFVLLFEFLISGITKKLVQN